MKLISLSATNFMPFKGNMKIEFPDDPVRNVLVVYGDNMRGKTSILNALRWSFYGVAKGRHLREIELQDLINREAALEGDWAMETCVQFEADGHKYILRRRATKKHLVARPIRPEDFEVVVGLQKDGLAVPAHLIEAEINQFAPEQVSRFFLFDGELLQEYENLLIEGNSTALEIKAAIEQVLGVPTLINGRDQLDTLLREAQKDQNRDLKHVQGLEAQAEKQADWQKKQEAFEKDLAALREKLKTNKDERNKLDDELEKLASVLKDKHKFEHLKQRQKEIDDSVKSKRADRQKLLAESWRDLLQPKLIEKRTQVQNLQDRVSGEITRRTKLETRIEDLKKMLEKRFCPMCKQPAPEADRVKVGHELGELEGELKQISIDQQQFMHLSDQIRDLNKVIKPLTWPQIASIDRDLTALNIELTRTENELEKLNEAAKAYEDADVAHKKARRDGLVREETLLTKNIEDTQKDLDDAKSQLAIISKAIEGLPGARAKKSTALVTIYRDLGKVFADSIERLRDQLRMHVAARASESFKALTTQKAYSKLVINQNYGLIILDEHGNPVTIRSAGAEQIVALSLIDGLARTGRAAGPVVMDTPFGRLDLRHRDNILRYLPTTTSQLVLLVHDGEIRRPSDLAPIASRIGAEYEIKEVNPRHSILERVTA
jgi:DNA sulfur modification protein DndD